MTSYKNSPIRQWQIDKIMRELKDIEEHRKLKKQLTHLQKIYHIFAYRYKHFDTEEEEETKGVSLRELTFILHEGKVTIEQMIEAETNVDVLAKIYTFFDNTKASIKRFKRWRRELRETDTRDPDEGTGFNIHCLKTRTGKWYYYNIMNEKDFAKIDLQIAKTHMRATKRLERRKDFLEMRPEEQKKKIEEAEERILERRYKRYARKHKIPLELMKNKTWDGKPVEIMKRETAWDGKPKYFDVDYTGVNLKDSLHEEPQEEPQQQEEESANAEE